MNNPQLLIDEYIAAAIAHGEASKIGNYKVANREYRKLTRIYRRLEKDRVLAETTINNLLENNNILVLVWAAAHALGLNMDIEKAQKILMDISKLPDAGIVGLGSEMTLKVWKEKGNLTF